MQRALISFLAGGLFGAGLLISQMTNPYKIITFLDVFGNWDPSLAFVMVAALITTFIGYRFVLGKEKPLFDAKFDLPTSKTIDGRLIGGATLFGMGWGLSGLCPGPAFSLATFGGDLVFYFLAGLIGSVAVFRLLFSKKAAH